jgi:hypothetical protein
MGHVVDKVVFDVRKRFLSQNDANRIVKTKNDHQNKENGTRDRKPNLPEYVATFLWEVHINKVVIAQNIIGK